MRIFNDKTIDIFRNLPDEENDTVAEIKEVFKNADQAKLAEEFFSETIGKDISNNSRAYNVYGLLKGTEFANKFKDLENNRLMRAGAGEFTL